MKQLTMDDLFKPNGNQTPCPYTNKCGTYGIGCHGESWWCKQEGINPKPIPNTWEEYVGRCEYCEWGQNKYTCQWSFDNPNKYSYKHCKNGSFWHPDSWKIEGLCGGCKYHNSFHYQGEDINNPIEEPNIYCTREEGSLNRQKPYERFYQHGFGVGMWHRQHEWDVCEAWEPSEYFKD